MRNLQLNQVLASGGLWGRQIDRLQGIGLFEGERVRQPPGDAGLHAVPVEAGRIRVPVAVHVTQLEEDLGPEDDSPWAVCVERSRGAQRVPGSAGPSGPCPR